MPPIRPPAERLASTVARMAPGTLGGTVRAAAKPVTPVGTVRTPNAGGGVGGIVFNFRGGLLTAVSDPIPSPADFTVSAFAAALRIAGSTDTTVQLEVNGAAVGSVTIPAGSTYAVAAVSAVIVAGDILQARVTSAGAGADGLGAVPMAA